MGSTKHENSIEVHWENVSGRLIILEALNPHQFQACSTFQYIVGSCTYNRICSVSYASLRFYSAPFIEERQKPKSYKDATLKIDKAQIRRSTDSEPCQ